MLRGRPLFPGTSTLHQLELILQTIPPPSKEGECVGGPLGKSTGLGDTAHDRSGPVGRLTGRVQESQGLEKAGPREEQLRVSGSSQTICKVGLARLGPESQPTE